MTRRARILAVAAVLLAAAAYERWLRPARAERQLPSRHAEWIWSAEARASDGWFSFFVYRDFELSKSIPDDAQLLLWADEGYWAFVNGKAVGSGGFREGGAMDAYRVAALLRPGTNRLVVQLRSRRAIGGLLAALHVGSQDPVVTDSGWRTSRRYERAMLAPGFLPEDVGEVKVWGRPPVGSWGSPRTAAAVPILGEQLVGAGAREAARIRLLGQPDWERRVPAPDRRIPLGRWVVFDLGAVTHGYLNVVFSTRAGARGLIYTSLERATGPDSADPATWFLAPPGRGSWSDVEPRTFRFVAVLADAEIAGLRAFETSPEWVEERTAGPARAVRAFGLAPPPSGPTVENEFWRELERVTGLTGREALESFPGG